MIGFDVVLGVVAGSALIALDLIPGPSECLAQALENFRSVLFHGVPVAGRSALRFPRPSWLTAVGAAVIVLAVLQV